VKGVIILELKKKEYEFLEHEIKRLETEGVISKQDQEKILQYYKVKQSTSFVQIILIVGALLLGIGVLSFVASNWMYLDKGVKFLLIIACIIGFNIAGVKMQPHYPKTSISLHYVAILMFGAGIFLIEQMFNLSINFNTSFLLWAIGSLVIAYYLKDLALLIFSTLLLFVYLNGSMLLDETSYPLAILLFLPALYVLLKKWNDSSLFAFFLNALTINTIALVLLEFVPKLIDHDPYKVALFILFAIGIIITYLPVRPQLRKVTHFQGHLLHGIAGLFLTYQFSIFFALAYFVFLLYLVYKGNLTSIAIICALIFRYYVDFSFDFLPKSFAFILGGIILIGFGFFFEKQRKRREIQ
jgi:uncharacterized membrane protein